MAKTKAPQVADVPAEAPRPEDPKEVAVKIEISRDIPIAEASEITASEAQHLLCRGSKDR